MRSLSLVAMIGVCFLGSGCGSSTNEPRPPEFTFEPISPKSDFSRLMAERDQLQVRSIETLTGKEKIFLVAGGSDSANFAQQVIDQRRHWMGLGFSSDEIACFYVRPTLSAMYRDLKQYRRFSQSPDQIDWTSLYSSLERNIQNLETQLKLGDEPSLPQYFSN